MLEQLRYQTAKLIQASVGNHGLSWESAPEPSASAFVSTALRLNSERVTHLHYYFTSSTRRF